MVRENLADNSLVDSRNDLQRIHSDKVLTPYEHAMNGRQSSMSHDSSLPVNQEPAKTVYNDTLMKYCNRAQGLLQSTKGLEQFLETRKTKSPSATKKKKNRSIMQSSN